MQVAESCPRKASSEVQTQRALRCLKRRHDRERARQVERVVVVQKAKASTTSKDGVARETEKEIVRGVGSNREPSSSEVNSEHAKSHACVLTR